MEDYKRGVVCVCVCLCVCVCVCVCVGDRTKGPMLAAAVENVAGNWCTTTFQVT